MPQPSKESDQFTSKQVIKNATIQTIAKVLLMLMGFVSTIVVTRYLGPTRFGAFNYCFTYFVYFNVICDPGLTAIVVREIAGRCKVEGEQLAGIVGSLRLISSCLAAVVMCLTAVILHFPRHLLLPICLMSLTYVTLYFGQGLFQPLLQARLRMDIQSAADLLSNLFWTLGAVAIVVMKQGTVSLFVAIYVVSTAVNSLVVIGLSRKLFRFRLKTDLTYWKEILVEAWPVAVSGLLTTLYFSLDATYLLKLKSQYAVGIYGAAHKFVDQALPIGFFFATSLYPMLSRYHKSGDKQVNRVFQRSLDLMTLLGVTIATFGIIFSKFVILMLYSKAFLPSAVPLGILSVAILMMCLNRIVGYNIYAMGRQKLYLVTGIVALVVNYALNTLLIPRFSYVGCSIAKLMTESCVFLMAFIYTVHLMKFRPSPRVPLLCVLSGGITWGVVHLLKEMPTISQLLVALMVYPLVLFATKAITIEEVKGLLKRNPKAEGSP